MLHWTKTPTGYSLAGHRVHRVRRTWVLETADGVTHILGRRASFDDAEAIIRAA